MQSAASTGAFREESYVSEYSIPLQMLLSKQGFAGVGVNKIYCWVIKDLSYTND